MNLKQTKYIRVITTKSKHIGKIFKVSTVNYILEQVVVNIQKENRDYLFNFSDVQEVFPEAVVEGYVLGVGDINGDRVLIGTYPRNGGVGVILKDGRENCWYYLPQDFKLSDITPLYTPKGTEQIMKESFETELCNYSGNVGFEKRDTKYYMTLENWEGMNELEISRELYEVSKKYFTPPKEE